MTEPEIDVEQDLAPPRDERLQAEIADELARALVARPGHLELRRASPELAVDGGRAQIQSGEPLDGANELRREPGCRAHLPSVPGGTSRVCATFAA